MLDFAVDIAETQLPCEVNCVLYHFYWRGGGKQKCEAAPRVEARVALLLCAVR